MQKAVVYKEFTRQGVLYQVGDILEMEQDDYDGSNYQEISPWYVNDKDGLWLCDEESDFFFEHLEIYYGDDK